MKIVALIGVLLFSNILYSQTHNEVWAKVIVTKKINHHFNVSAEYQHRTQSNYLVPDKAALHNPLANLFRLWLGYKIKNNLEIVVSPFAYFNNYDIASISGLTKQNQEIRLATGITKTYLLKEIINKNRLLYELRFINFNNLKNIVQQRLRLQNAVVLPITKIRDSKVNVNVQNELIIKNQLGNTSFDQERIAAIVQLKAKHIEYNLGYQYCIQNVTTSTIYRNQYLVGTAINF